MSVVRTYLDYDKSGLHLRGRARLQSLLEDVKSVSTGYTIVLVYDISRWGCFQNIDERSTTTSSTGTPVCGSPIARRYSKHSTTPPCRAW
jgi:DNA invertase Pin-like site-specific DNA recombinase